MSVVIVPCPKRMLLDEQNFLNVDQVILPKVTVGSDVYFVVKAPVDSKENISSLHWKKIRMKEVQEFLPLSLVNNDAE